MFNIFQLGEMEANCYLIGDDKSGEVIVIDPGGNPSTVIDFIKRRNLTIKYIINTHGHIDHIGGNRELVEFSRSPLCIHSQDESFLIDPAKNLSLYLGNPFTSPPAQILLKEKDKITLSNIEFEVIHTPGHTPGSISLVTDKYILTGDTLFNESIGRTDLPNASFFDIIKSIKEKLVTLDKDLIVYPGHGQPSTIEHEIKNNPFI